MENRNEITARRFSALILYYVGHQCQFNPEWNKIVINNIAYKCNVGNGEITIYSGSQSSPVTTVIGRTFKVKKRWRHDWQYNHNQRYLEEIIEHEASSIVLYNAWVERTRWVFNLIRRLETSKLPLKITVKKDLESDGRLHISISGEKLPGWQFSQLIKHWYEFLQHKNGASHFVKMLVYEINSSFEASALLNRQEAEELVQNLIENHSVSQILES